MAVNPSMRGIRMSMRTTSGRQRAGHHDRLGAIGRFRDDLQVGLVVDERAETVTNQRLIVGEEHGDHRRESAAASAVSSGSLATTR